MWLLRETAAVSCLLGVIQSSIAMCILPAPFSGPNMVTSSSKKNKMVMARMTNLRFENQTPHHIHTVRVIICIVWFDH